MEFVWLHRSPGDTYFLPVRVPDLVAATRGSLSSDFKPLAEKKVDAKLIPVDLQRFRLHTGTPIFVDFKSIPYKDADVIEWRNRLEVAERLHAEIGEGKLDAARGEMRALGITHVVLPAGTELRGRGLLKVPFDDSHYQIYRIIGP